MELTTFAVLDDQRVLNVMKKLTFVVDPEIDCQFPEKRLAWVEFSLKNGMTLRSEVYAMDEVIKKVNHALNISVHSAHRYLACGKGFLCSVWQLHHQAKFLINGQRFGLLAGDRRD